MVSEQPTRVMVRELQRAGWTAGRAVGSHTKWRCPCGQHSFSLPDGHRSISPGVVTKVRKAMEVCHE